MPNILDIPQSLLTKFTREQGIELRKLLDFVYTAATGGSDTGFKFIEEQGADADSGTILSGSEIVATVASQNSDVANSFNSVLVGGSNHTVLDSSETVVLGGSNGNVDTSTSAFLVGGSSNEILSGTRSGIVAGSGNSLDNSTDSVVLGGLNNTVDNAIRSAILAGSNNRASGSDVAVIGQGAIANRQGSLAVGSGANGNGLATAIQTGLIAGRAATTGVGAVSIDFCSNGTLLVPENGVIAGDLCLTAVRASDLSSYMFMLIFLAKRIGSSTTIVTQDVVNMEGDAPLSTCTVNLVGTPNGVRVDVTGVAATNVSWSCSGIFTEQTVTT